MGLTVRQLGRWSKPNTECVASNFYKLKTFNKSECINCDSIKRTDFLNESETEWHAQAMA